MVEANLALTERTQMKKPSSLQRVGWFFFGLKNRIAGWRPVDGQREACKAGKPVLLSTSVGKAGIAECRSKAAQHG